MSVPAPQRWHELSGYLDQVLDLPPAERAAWLAGLRLREPDIAEEIASFLAEHEELDRGQFLESSVASVFLHPLEAGQRLGPYILLNQIGEGGMGTIWLAQRDDGRFQRQAAIKFLSLALAARGQERFKREGTILGRLVHPYIAQLLDAGVTAAGQPYLVLEHIQGEPIDLYCDGHNFPLETRLRLFLDVLSAVSHAHANLIVHRDLKPSNVLVNQEGQVKLLDFGVAKLLEDERRSGSSTLTREIGAALTPQYAAPEQLAESGITTATDVYALGVLLYVLLTGQHPAGPGPFTTAELLKFTVETDPRRPSEAVLRATDRQALVSNAAARATTPEKLARSLRGDLDTIVAKSLKKNPEERYVSATAMADDIGRYLKKQPIGARPDAWSYRAMKFIRRNRAATALVTLVVMAVLAGSVTTWIEARDARAQRDFALRELARASAFNDLNWFVLNDAAPSGKPFTVDDLLQRAAQIVERQHVDPITRVNLIVSIGRQYAGRGDFAKARVLLEKGYQQAQGLSDLATRAEAACDLGQALANTGDLDRAESLFQQGISSLPDRSPFHLERENCYLRGAEIAHNRTRGSEEVERAEAAQRELRLAPTHSDLDETSMLVSLASAYSDTHRMLDATRVFKSAADMYSEEGRDDTEHVATLYNNWGVALTLLGRPLDAEKVLRKALAIERVNGSEGGAAAMPLLNYGRALMQTERLPEAASYVARALDKARASGSRVALDQGLLLQADIFCLQGDLSSADRDLKLAAADLNHLPPGHIAHASLDSVQSLLAAARGDVNVALPLAGDAIRIAEAAVQEGYPRYYLQVYLNRRARLELRLGHLADAIADATRAAASAPDPHAPSQGTGEAYLLLGSIYQQQGNLSQARESFRLASTILQDAAGPDAPSAQQASHLAAQTGNP